MWRVHPAKKSSVGLLLFHVFGITTSEFQYSKKWRKMFIHFVNLSEFQGRNKMEFQSRSDLSQLRLSFLVNWNEWGIGGSFLFYSIIGMFIKRNDSRILLLQKWRKMVICFVNLLKFRSRNESNSSESFRCTPHNTCLS